MGPSSLTGWQDIVQYDTRWQSDFMGYFITQKNRPDRDERFLRHKHRMRTSRYSNLSSLVINDILLPDIKTVEFIYSTPKQTNYFTIFLVSRSHADLTLDRSFRRRAFTIVFSRIK